MKDTATRTVLSEMPLEVSAAMLQESLDRLPLWRRTEAEAYRQPIDTLQSATAYMLLCQLLSEATGQEKASPLFAYGAEGKPYLPEYPYLHFNISHCRRAVMCMLSNAPVGCDVEEIPSGVDYDVMPLCFSPQEIDRIERAESPKVEFTRLWTQKEALAKLHGTGLTDNIPHMLATPQARCAEFHTVVCPERGYVYTTCREKVGNIK